MSTEMEVGGKFCARPRAIPSLRKLSGPIKWNCRAAAVFRLAGQREKIEHALLQDVAANQSDVDVTGVDPLRKIEELRRSTLL